MKNILHLFKRDVQNVSRSVIGLVVVMGLIIVPCLYAWFNIAGSWDPYGNTGNLKIAVVNTDEGYESDLIPVEVNVGENVTATLRGNESFDWVVLNDREKAIEGVKSGAYYAAVVIPKTFSADMMTLFSTDVKHADIEFYENQKANAIAQIVTEKGSSAVQNQVNESFTETITSIGLKTVSSLLDYMSTDQVSNFIANLSSTLGDSIEDLQDVQANASSLAGILSSTSDSLTSASGMLQQTGTVDESTKRLMEHAKSGMSDSKEALKAANDAINAAIDGSAGSFDNVSAELAKAFDAANQHVDLTVSQLNDAAAALNTRADDIDATADQLRGFAEQVSDEKLQESLKSVATSLNRIAVEYRNSAKDLTATAKSLSDSMAEVNSTRAEVDQAIADAKAGISGAKSDYDSTFSVKAKELKKTVSGILDSLDGISGDLDSAVDGLTDASGSLAKGLSKAAKLVNKASDQLGEASDKISAFKDELDGALMSDDLATIKTMIGNDPEGLAVSLSGPVALDRKPVYPIRNYGSAMAPLFMNLTFWIGAFMLLVIMRQEADGEGIPGLTLAQRYWGRYLFLAAIAVMQAVICCVGVLALGVQTVSAPALIFAAALASLAYLSIIYAFSVTLQHIGKGICVILVFAQIPGATGLYPIEMTSPFFQSIYPLFPFTYGIGAMREAICGFYGGQYVSDLLVLALFLVLFMALGLLIRPLMANVNRMVARQVRDGGLFNGEDVDIPVRPYRISQIMRALSDKDTYATALQQRYATFNRWYPRLMKGALVLGVAVPVVLAVIFALTPTEKVWLLTGWLIWIIVIFVALVVIESLRFSFERQLKLESLSDASLIDLYGATADVERAACMDARDAGFGGREHESDRDGARDGAEGEEARHE